MKIPIDYLPRDEVCLNTVSDWIDGEWSHLNPGRTRGQVFRRLRNRAGSRRLPLTLLARDGKLPVGTASLLEGDMDGRRDREPWLSAVYVLPAYRGRGLGTALCERIEAEARRLGLERLLLFTEDREKFYGRRGWMVDERTVYRGAEVVVMSKQVSG